MWEEIKPKKFHKIQVTIPFFHVDLLLSHVQCVHLASITQGCCEYTHITNILRVLWLVRACSEHIACAFCSKNTHAQTLYAHKCALAIRMLHVCGLHAAYSQHAGCELFFSARGMFAIFLSVLFSSGLLWWVSKECGMGQGLVLVSPCFRENIVATCKIGSFLCSLDNLLQKNVIVLFFGNQVSNGAHLKKGYFWPTFHIF